MQQACANYFNIGLLFSFLQIAGLQEVIVTSGEDMVRYLELGSASRATGATAMNSRSSRSHAIFTVTLEQKELQG